jgi:uncharacterized protein (DUF58 family)
VVPEKRLAAIAFAITLLALIAGLVPSLGRPLLAVDAAVVLVVALDALLVRGRRFEVTREAPDILSVGRKNAIVLVLRNLSGRTLRGVVADDPVLDAVSEGIPAAFTVGPAASVELRYDLTPTRRGPRRFGSVHVRYRSPLGLVARVERFPLPAAADVYPDVHAARALELLRRQGRQDARLGSLRVRGGDTEFERLRPYQIGDDVRHIDWRASARRDDPTVRQHQAESNQNVVFAIDVGRGMRGESDGMSHVDHALNAALLVADVALRGGDKAGLLVFADTPEKFLRPTGGRTGAHRLTRAAYDLEASVAATDYRAATTFLAGQVRTRSLFVVFTHLLDPRSADELATSFRGLMPRHLPLCVLLRDTDVEDLASAPAARTEDLYVRAAAAEALSFRDGIVRSLRRSGVLVVDARPKDVTPELVKRYLDVKARRLL